MLSLIVKFLGRKYKPTWARFSMKAPHVITLPGCFVVLTENFGLYRDALLGLRINFGTPFITVKVLLSLNITFLHSAAVQCRYFWRKLGLFFFIAVVSMSFLAARQYDRRDSSEVDDEFS